MIADIPRRHAPRVHAEDLVVEPVEMPLMLRNELRLERPLSVARNPDRNRAPTGPDGLRPGTVTAVGLGLRWRLSSVVAQMLRHLRLHGPVHERGGQLFQQPVWADQILRPRVALQQLVHQLGTDPRLGSSRFLLVLLRHIGLLRLENRRALHKIPDTPYGKVNEHNGWIPRDHWLQEDERQAILDFHAQHPLDGYRRLAFMMIDEDVAYASPSSVYRVLAGAGRLDRWNEKPSKKGTGFVQPLRPHEHWHIDITYLNIAGTFFYLCSVLDGASRAIVEWEIRESMKEVDVECILQRARERYPHARTRIISDNGPQFIARDFKVFIRLTGMTHWRTSPYYPQSNGKIERWHGSLKVDAFRPAAPQTFEDAERVVGRYIDYYNDVRLHSAIGYVAPRAILEGRQQQIWDERDRKLAEARESRAQRRAAERHAA